MPPSLLNKNVRLRFFGSTNGARFRAGTATDASIGIDDVLSVSFGNRFNGATLGASAATETSIGIDLISHD